MKVDTVVIIVLLLVLVYFILNKPEHFDGFDGLDSALLDYEQKLPEWDDQDIHELEKKIRAAAEKRGREVRSDQKDSLRYDASDKGVKNKDDAVPAATSPGQVENNLTEMFSSGHVESAFSPIDQFSMGQMVLEKFSPAHVLSAKMTEHITDPMDRVQSALFDRRDW